MSLLDDFMLGAAGIKDAVFGGGTAAMLYAEQKAQEAGLSDAEREALAAAAGEAEGAGLILGPAAQASVERIEKEVLAPAFAGITKAAWIIGGVVVVAGVVVVVLAFSPAGKAAGKAAGHLA